MTVEIGTSFLAYSITPQLGFACGALRCNDSDVIAGIAPQRGERGRLAKGETSDTSKTGTTPKVQYLRYFARQRKPL